MSSTSQRSFSHASEGSDRIDRAREAARRSAELIADLMDAAWQIPGTRVRIGLDPLLGLVPGIGDTVASLVGSTILLLAHQLGVPRIVQVRMALNVLLNGTIGVIPGIGDLFSVWYRSNLRNARLLRLHSSAERRNSTRGDWAFVVSLLGGVLTAMVLMAAAGVWVIAQIWRAVT